MTYDEARKQAEGAIKEVARMGIWDGVNLDIENGEPVVYAILQKPPVLKFLMQYGVIKAPELPKRIRGIRCEVRIQRIARMR